jgi:ribosomal-protein-alanine N-acetyltransferase
MARLVTPSQSLAESLAGIARAAFEGHAAGWGTADFLALGGPPRAALICDDACRAGILILRMAADEAEILNFGVVPEARRQGLGTELMSAAEALARDLAMARIFLEVAGDNLPARRLYEKRGFADVARRKGYYLRPDGSRVDALVLERTL